MRNSGPFEVKVTLRSSPDEEADNGHAKLSVDESGDANLSFEIGDERGYFVNIKLSNGIIRQIASNLLLSRSPSATRVAGKNEDPRLLGFKIPSDELNRASKVVSSDDLARGYFVEGYAEDRVVIVSESGKFFTPDVEKLVQMSQRGHPILEALDLHQGERIIGAMIWRKGERLLLASTVGDGFIVRSDDVFAPSRVGKQVLSLASGVKAALCRRVAGDSLAVVGEERRMLIFPVSDLPEMRKGKGVRLQKYKSGGFSDATTFNKAQGLTWKDPAGRLRTEADLSEWEGARATAGRMAPRGFPRDNKFT